MLEAAVRVFARDGVAEARIDAIAAEAGVSVGTVYNVYGDRAGLVAAVLDAGRQQFIELVRAYFESSDGVDFEPRLRGLVRLLVGHMRAHWPMLQMLAQARATPPCGPTPATGAPLVVRELHGHLSALVRQGVEAGAVGEVDVHVATCALMGAIRNTIDVDLTLGLDAPSESRADAIVQIFLEGVARRP
ncbi:MAG: TetR/AcrR family transcriptional regulator [Myxococcota bacterium]